MAGDWIKIESVTPDKPELIAVAAMLGLDQDAVLGKLVRLWIWADQQTRDGYARSVTEAFLDRCAGVTGFAHALQNAGWLEKKSDGFVFVNFDRHNGKTAKSRSLSQKRMKRFRYARSVTTASPEKRREENIIPPAAQEVCTEPLRDSVPAAADASILEFPTTGKGPQTWGLTAAKLAQYQASFPGLDVLAQCRAARQWCIDNAARRKTARGMPAFLARWLSRAQDQGAAHGVNRRTDAAGGNVGREQERLNRIGGVLQRFIAGD